MKKLLLILPLFLLLFSCAKEDDNDDDLLTKLATPSLQSPINGKELVAATFNFNFSWSAVVDADVYELQIADNTSFTNSKKITSIPNNVDLSSSDIQSGSTYYWRVKASASGFASSDYSEVFSFKYTDGSGGGGGSQNVPTLLTPTDNSTVNTTRPTLTWTETPLDNSLYYIIQFANDFTFSSVFYFGQPMSNTFTIPAAIDPLENYPTVFWRVSADGGTTFSEHFTLNIAL